MDKKTKDSILASIVMLIVLAYGAICGYIIGKAEGEKETMNRYNKLLEDHYLFTHTNE